ncbi:uncharacterized protein ACOB8E_000834 [Sarcophilus harrisii]
MAPKEQVKSLSAPFLNKKRTPEVLESSSKSPGDDIHSSPETKWKKTCKKTWIEEEKEVCGEIYEKGNVATPTKDNLHEDDFKESKKILETSPTLAKKLRDSVEKEKHKCPVRVRILKSFAGQTEQDRPFHKNVPVFPTNVCSQKSTLQLKNDNEPEIECTYVAKKPELIPPRKCKEKTKRKTILFENSHHSVSNSTDELNRWRPSLPYREKIAKMDIDSSLKQCTQRIKIQFEIIQAKSPTLEKEKIPPQKEVDSPSATLYSI